DFVPAPDHTIGNVVQGRDNARRAGLPDLGQADGIIGAEPTPSLFHDELFHNYSSSMLMESFIVADAAGALPRARQHSPPGERRCHRPGETPRADGGASQRPPVPR